MRCVVQRVASSSVTSEGVLAGQIGPGLMVLIGVSVDDTEADVKYMAEKIPNLRIFDDENGVMNRSVLDAGEVSLPSPSSRCTAIPGAAAGLPISGLQSRTWQTVFMNSLFPAGGRRGSMSKPAFSVRRCRSPWLTTVP